jgi:streptogramin lyase
MIHSWWRTILLRWQKASSGRYQPSRSAGRRSAIIRPRLDPLEDRCLLSLAVNQFPIPTDGAVPSGITTGPDGNLWFTESNGNKIGEINPVTHVVSEFAVPMAGSYPYMITAGPDGNLWFTEYYVSTIGEFNPSTHAFSEYILPMTNSDPIGITVGPDGDLWFTEQGSNKIGEINPVTDVVSEFAVPTNGSQPYGITVGPDGNLWFTEYQGNKIGEFDPVTHVFSEVSVPTQYSYPGEITAGSDGNLWFTEGQGNKIGMINPSTHVISEFALPTSSSTPTGITHASDGTLWFAESRSSKIGEINPVTHVISEIPLPSNGSSSYGITASPDGDLWFTDPDGDNIDNVALVSTVSAVAGNNQIATVGTAFGSLLAVQVSDAFGDPISGATVTFTATYGAGGAGGAFASTTTPIAGGAGSSSALGIGTPGTTTPMGLAGSIGDGFVTTTITTNAQGLALAPVLIANHLAGKFTVTATVDDGGSPIVFLLNNTPGEPASITPSGSLSQNTPVGLAYGTLLQATVRDAFGNPVPNVAVTFAAPTVGASGTFNAVTTVPTNALGVATAPAFTANQIPGNFTVTASAVELSSPASFNLANTTVPAAIVAVSGTSQHVTVTSSYAALRVRVTGANGKPVRGITVVFALPAIGPGGTFAGSAAVVTDANGVGHAPPLTANHTAGTFTVTAWVAGLATPAKFTLTNRPCAPAAIVSFGGTTQSATVGKAFKPLQAQVLDAFGNPISGVKVTFAAPANGPGGEFAGKATVTVVTGANGVATAPALTANVQAGGFTVTASLSRAALEVSFNLTNLAAIPKKVKKAMSVTGSV